MWVDTILALPIGKDLHVGFRSSVPRRGERIRLDFLTEDEDTRGWYSVLEVEWHYADEGTQAHIYLQEEN